jgi:hypothetical protein
MLFTPGASVSAISSTPPAPHSRIAYGASWTLDVSSFKRKSALTRRSVNWHTFSSRPKGSPWYFSEVR